LDRCEIAQDESKNILIIKAELLALLLHVWEVLNSNISPETGYAEVFHSFSQSTWQIPG
jgi:hypothetical protein